MCRQAVAPVFMCECTCMMSASPDWDRAISSSAHVRTYGTFWECEMSIALDLNMASAFVQISVFCFSATIGRLVQVAVTMSNPVASEFFEGHALIDLASSREARQTSQEVRCTPMDSCDSLLWSETFGTRFWES